MSTKFLVNVTCIHVHIYICPYGLMFLFETVIFFTNMLYQPTIFCPVMLLNAMVV